jgi:predicted CXXCH cytochrome family protein
VAYAIEGYFARKFLDPDSADPGGSRRRRPDRTDAAESCRDGPLACARQRTLTEVSNQFSVRGCVSCHEVTDTEAADVYSRFQVHPVRLVSDYFDSARFDHAAHLTQENKTGDEACLTCHSADTSSTSADLLIPDIDNCTQCHGDPSVPDVVPLQCTGCHEFHPPTFGATRGLHMALGETPK